MQPVQRISGAVDHGQSNNCSANSAAHDCLFHGNFVVFGGYPGEYALHFLGQLWRVGPARRAHRRVLRDWQRLQCARLGTEHYSPGTVHIHTADRNHPCVQVMGGGIGATVVRLPMVYGPGDSLHRLHGVLKRVQDNRPAIILADDHAAWTGPRGYVENVAHAIAVASTSDRALGQTYHLCDEPTLTELDWQQKIAAQTEWRGKFVVLPNRLTPKHLLMPGNAAQHVVANSERIRKDLGYKEPFSMDEAIRRTIRWEAVNPPTGPSFHNFDYEAEDAALAQSFPSDKNG